MCTHPDSESMVIAVPGAPEHLVDLAKWSRINLNYVNGEVPRRVPQMLTDLGCTQIHTEGFTVVIEDPDSDAYAFPHWLRSWQRKGALDISEEDLDTWDRAIDAALHGNGFFFSLTYLLTYATVT